MLQNKCFPEAKSYRYPLAVDRHPVLYLQQEGPGPLAEARQTALPPLSQAAGFAASGGGAYNGNLASRSFAAAAPVPAAAALWDAPGSGANTPTRPATPTSVVKAQSGTPTGWSGGSGVPRTAEVSAHDWQHSFADDRH